MSEVPIVVGVGDFVNRSTAVADAREPLALILEAIEVALKDAGLPDDAGRRLKSSIDSIDVVRTWTWPYDDLPGDIARNLGVTPRHTFYSDHGGNKPAKLFDDAARRIAQGKTKVAVVTGGEALASLSACAAAKQLPPPGWTKTTEGVDAVFSATGRDHGETVGGLHSIGDPIQVYPLFENGLRARRGQTVDQNNKESARLYADFAQVAESHPYAWNYGKPAKTATEIGTVTARNRMICFPYPLLMNAFNTVNLAGACILTSTTFAEELGIPKTQWIYALAGAGTRDSDNFWERPNFHSSPAIERSVDTALQQSGLNKDEIDLFDFYSCFPVVPKIAATHLNLSIADGQKLTLLGGLTSFGGAGNNYSMHAITEMTRQLRRGRGKHGLILANGGVMTYQHVLLLSTTRRRGGSPYPPTETLPEVITDVPVPKIEASIQGEQDAVVETYTVEFKRDNTPLRAYVVGRLKSTGHRFVANHGDDQTLNELVSGTDEKIGRAGTVRSDGKRNLFTLQKKDISGKL